MRKPYLQILVALMVVASLGLATRAQDVDHLKVSIPFAFVLNGRTLPAGTYTVSPVPDATSTGLILSDDNNAAAIVLPIEVENDYADKTGIIFEQTGGQYILSEIRTTDHLFKIPVSPAGSVIQR